MARKSLIQREKKRQKLETKYHLIRRSSKKEISKVPSLSEKWEIHGKLQSPPRNSAPTRLHRRCAWAVRALSHMDSSMCSSAPDPEMWIIQGTLAWRTSPVRTGV